MSAPGEATFATCGLTCPGGSEERTCGCASPSGCRMAGHPDFAERRSRAASRMVQG
jgi:hypothetical protein